jgi:hypothetical protein
MAELDEQSKSYFQIPPTKDNPTKVVLCNQGFDLDSIMLITEVAMISKLSYVFFVHIGYSNDFKLEFEFERKLDAMQCQRELTRAWSGTGEFQQIRNKHV